MVILLEPTQNAAMKQADPYASCETIWYHVIWGTQGSRLAVSPRVASSRRVRSQATSSICDPTKRDQPIRRGSPGIQPIAISSHIRASLACAICDLCARRRLAIRCLSIGINHVHALMKLDADEELAHATVEDCKRVSCLLACANRGERLWAKGCELLPVRSELHFDRISQWICEDRRQGNHVWKHPRLIRAEEECQT